MQRQNVQSVEQILPEVFPGDFTLQVTIGSGNDPHVHLSGVYITNGLDFTVLDHAQNPGLELKGHIADLVEENGPGVCSFKKSQLSLGSPGKGPFFMAEELAFEQSVRNATTILSQKSTPAPAAQPVNFSGQKLLA